MSWTLRREQMEALAAAADERFYRRLVAYLRQRYRPAVEGLDDATLLARVRLGVERARSHGLTYESSLATFVVGMFVVGPNFDRHPAIRRVLREPSVLPDRRISLLRRRVPPAAWEEARRTGDPAWPTDDPEPS